MFTQAQTTALENAGFKIVPTVEGDDADFIIWHEIIYKFHNKSEFAPEIPGYVQDDGRISLYGLEVTADLDLDDIVTSTANALIRIYESV